MKPQIVLAGLIIILTSCDVGYVATVPESSVYVETAPPYVGAIWIGPEYVWRHHHYEVVDGHWEHGREGRVWDRGRWEHNERGHYWQGGRWR